MIRPTYSDDDGWTFPEWWPKLARRVVETWTSAKQAGDADLLFRQWGDHTRTHAIATLYLTPGTAGIGVTIPHESRWPRGAGQSDGGWIALELHLGVVLLSLSVHAGDVVRPRT